MSRWNSRSHISRFALLAFALAVASSGCVQRRMTIRSDPPGALVYVDSQHAIGSTPVSHDFIYYGTREIRLVKDGYETLTVLQPMSSPWYEYLGLDFLSENLWPEEVRDERVYSYQLTPQRGVTTEELLGRAEDLRRGNMPGPHSPPLTLPQPPAASQVIAPPAETTIPPRPWPTP